MGIGTSIFLVALGAILRYAVNDAIEGVELATVGLILMIAGIAGLVISFLYMTISRDRDRGGGETVVRERSYSDPAPPRP